MRRPATVLALMAAFSLHAATPREQLVLAEEAEDTYAQIELLRRILDAEPADAAVQEKLIRAWLRVSDYAMARRALEAWPAAPEDFRTTVSAQILFEGDKKTAEAVALLQAYLAKNPGDLVLRRQLVGYLQALGESAEVVNVLSTLAPQASEADLFLVRARAKRELADYDGALADFAIVESLDAAKANDLRPDYERLRAALPILRAADAQLAKNPDDFVALVTRGRILEALNGNRAAVKAAANRAWELAPASMAARLLYARTLPSSRAAAELQVNAGAKAPPWPSVERLLVLDVAVAKNPRDAEALAARSFVLNDVPEQFRLGLADAEAALAIDPKNSTAHLERIYALVKLGNAPAAAAALAEFEKTKPAPDKLARAFQNLAEAEMAAYRFEPALAYATRGIKLKPTPGLYQTRAAVLNRLGRTAEAQADLTSAKKLEKK